MLLKQEASWPRLDSLWPQRARRCRPRRLQQEVRTRPWAPRGPAALRAGPPPGRPWGVWPRAARASVRGAGGGPCGAHHRPALLLSPAVLRDISERGRDLEQILSQYITFVKPAFEEFCLPVSCALGLLPSLEIKSIRRTRLRVAAVLCAEGPGRGMSRPLPSSSVLPLVFPLARRFPSWNPSGLCTPCWAGSGCGGPFIGGQTRPSGSEPRCRVPLQRPPALRRPPSVRLPPRAFPSVCGGGGAGGAVPGEASFRPGSWGL